MFPHFDKSLFDAPDFKEDSVREVIILPILNRLGYLPSGKQAVIRSKQLVQPFIYVGTRKHPVKIFPDYTLYFDGKPVLALDAKSPCVNLDNQANIQQAYSYAIHPEIRVEHFALCNGRRLVVYSTHNDFPILDLEFDNFYNKWESIEKCLAPNFLLNPELRKLKPDFGMAVSRMGLSKIAELVMVGTRLNLFSKLSEELYSATVNTEHAGQTHCVSFDFSPEHLPKLLAGLPKTLSEQFSEALSRAPFQAAADLAIEADLMTHLGDPIKVEHETFIPLVIDEVLASRFNSSDPGPGGEDIPNHIFRLKDAFKVQQ